MPHKSNLWKEVLVLAHSLKEMWFIMKGVMKRQCDGVMWDGVMVGWWDEGML